MLRRECARARSAAADSGHRAGRDHDLSVSPTSISEDGGASAVRVTARLGLAADAARGRAIPVALVLGGTTDAGDYTVSGTLTVTIPAKCAVGDGDADRDAGGRPGCWKGTRRSW